MKAIELKKLSKSFGEQDIFKDVSFSLPDKGLYLILGQSGSGKSTLFDILSGIDVGYSGSLAVLGRDHKRMGEDERSSFRLTKIGFLRQGYDLLPHESALRNVLFPFGGHVDKAAKSRAQSLLNLVGLGDRAKEPAFKLSGGEKQRLALARALMNGPMILLADEPTGALDESSAEMVKDLLTRTSKSILVIVSTHDQTLFKDSADGILAIEKHKIKRKRACKLGKKIPSDEQNKTDSKTKISFPLAFWFEHVEKILSARKFKTFLSAFFLFFSFASLGLSVYLGRDVSSKMSKAFASLTGEGTVTMGLRNSDISLYNNAYSAPLSAAASLCDAIGGDAEVVASYISPFESLFVDANDFFVKRGTKRHPIDGMSIRSINDFLPLLEDEAHPVHPSLPKTLEIDEVVLGITEAQMISLAGTLQCKRTYEAVGQCLFDQRGLLYLETANDSWSYYDLECLFVKGVRKSAVATLYHLDPLWNESFYETRMCLPSSDGSEFSTPWTLEKVYGVRDVADETAFFETARGDDFSRYSFEKDSYLYDQTHNEVENARPDNRYFMYLADRFGIGKEAVDALQDINGVVSASHLPEGAYRSFPSAMAEGFVEPLIVGKDEDSVLSLSESLSRVPNGFEASLPELPEHTAAGSYLRARSDNLLFSSDMSDLSWGNEPSSLDEVILSLSLYEKLGSPSGIYIAAAKESRNDDGYHMRTYSINSLKVVGAKDWPNDALFQSPYWLGDYFNSRVGMRRSLLEAKETLIHLVSPSYSAPVSSYLGSRYQEYTFIDASLLVNESLESVFGYIEVFLGFAVLCTSLLSVFLVFVLSSSYVGDNRAEGRYFYLLGLSRKDISNGFSMGSFTLIGSAFVGASMSLFGMEFLFDSALSELFGMPFAFVYDPLPHLAMLLFFSLTSLVSFIFTERYSKGSDFVARSFA